MNRPKLDSRMNVAHVNKRMQIIDTVHTAGGFRRCRRRSGSSDRLSLLTKVTLERYEVTNRILDIVRKLDDKGKPMSEAKAKELAKRLEAIMYRAAPSLKEYVDKKTMKIRLEAILRNFRHAMVESKTTQEIPPYDESKSIARKRLDILREMLGSDKYNKMRQLAREIRRIRSTSTSWIAILGNSKNQQGRPSVPVEVSDIYFRTKLIEAEAHVSAETGSLDIGRIFMFDWDILINEATRKIAAFHKLEQMYEASIRRSASFCCMGGMCGVRRIKVAKSA